MCGSVVHGTGLAESTATGVKTLSVDQDHVPYVDVCAAGQVVTRAGAGWACADDVDTTYSGADFALSNQPSCASGFVTGIDATGHLTCGADTEPPNPTLGQSCPAGSVVLGINADGTLNCDPNHSGTLQLEGPSGRDLGVASTSGLPSGVVLDVRATNGAGGAIGDRTQIGLGYGGNEVPPVVIASEIMTTFGREGTTEDLIFATRERGGPDGSAPPTERMRITGNGYVGIGTTAPTSRLRVSGGYLQLDLRFDTYDPPCADCDEPGEAGRIALRNSGDGAGNAVVELYVCSGRHGWVIFGGSPGASPGNTVLASTHCSP